MHRLPVLDGMFSQLAFFDSPRFAQAWNAAADMLRAHELVDLPSRYNAEDMADGLYHEFLVLELLSSRGLSAREVISQNFDRFVRDTDLHDVAEYWQRLVTTEGSHYGSSLFNPIPIRSLHDDQGRSVRDIIETFQGQAEQHGSVETEIGIECPEGFRVGLVLPLVDYILRYYGNSTKILILSPSVHQSDLMTAWLLHCYSLLTVGRWDERILKPKQITVVAPSEKLVDLAKVIRLGTMGVIALDVALLQQAEWHPLMVALGMAGKGSPMRQVNKARRLFFALGSVSGLQDFSVRIRIDDKVFGSKRPSLSSSAQPKPPRSSHSKGLAPSKPVAAVKQVSKPSTSGTAKPSAPKPPRSLFLKALTPSQPAAAAKPVPKPSTSGVLRPSVRRPLENKEGNIALHLRLVQGALTSLLFRMSSEILTLQHAAKTPEQLQLAQEEIRNKLVAEVKKYYLAALPSKIQPHTSIEELVFGHSWPPHIARWFSSLNIGKEKD